MIFPSSFGCARERLGPFGRWIPFPWLLVVVITREGVCSGAVCSKLLPGHGMEPEKAQRACGGGQLVTRRRPARQKREPSVV